MDTTSNTYTNAQEPSLTLDALLKVYQELEALLPELLYKTHEYVPRTKDGAPSPASAMPVESLAYILDNSLDEYNETLPETMQHVATLRDWLKQQRPAGGQVTS